MNLITMSYKWVLNIVLALFAFVPFGVAVLYTREHGRTAPSFEVSLGFLVMYVAIVGVIIFLERRTGLFRE
jgi:L-cystine uptake protein TcyP (sodium:dicarboxylate symporter family)